MGHLVNSYALGAGVGDVTPSNATWWNAIEAYSSSESSPAPDPVSGATNIVTIAGIDQTITLSVALTGYVETGLTVGSFWVTKNSALEGSVVEMTANGTLMTFSCVAGDQIAFSVESNKIGSGSAMHQIEGTITITNSSDGGATLASFTFNALGEVVFP